MSRVECLSSAAMDSSANGVTFDEAEGQCRVGSVLFALSGIPELTTYLTEELPPPPPRSYLVLGPGKLAATTHNLDVYVVDPVTGSECTGGKGLYHVKPVVTL